MMRSSDEAAELWGESRMCNFADRLAQSGSLSAPSLLASVALFSRARARKPASGPARSKNGDTERADGSVSNNEAPAFLPGKR